jgi:hypothetical protein
MKHQDYDAHNALRDTPKRRQVRQWLPMTIYITPLDLMFVGAVGLTALYLIVEHHAKAWELFRYGGGLWKLLSVVTGGG